MGATITHEYCLRSKTFDTKRRTLIDTIESANERWHWYEANFHVKQYLSEMHRDVILGCQWQGMKILLSLFKRSMRRVQFTFRCLTVVTARRANYARVDISVHSSSIAVLLHDLRREEHSINYFDTHARAETKHERFRKSCKIPQAFKRWLCHKAECTAVRVIKHNVANKFLSNQSPPSPHLSRKHPL